MEHHLVRQLDDLSLVLLSIYFPNISKFILLLTISEAELEITPEVEMLVELEVEPEAVSMRSFCSSTTG